MAGCELLERSRPAGLRARFLCGNPGPSRLPCPGSRSGFIQAQFRRKSLSLWPLPRHCRWTPQPPLSQSLCPPSTHVVWQVGASDMCCGRKSAGQVGGLGEGIWARGGTQRGNRQVSQPQTPYSSQPLGFRGPGTQLALNTCS